MVAEDTQTVLFRGILGMKNKVTLTNMMTGLALQLCLIVSGLIVPRLIL